MPIVGSLDKGAALASEGAQLTTAQGGTNEVDVLSVMGTIARIKHADRNHRPLGRATYAYCRRRTDRPRVSWRASWRRRSR